MTIREEYDAVNNMLKLVGDDPIPMPESGTDRERFQHLLDAYLTILMAKVPRYADLHDPRLIPDRMNCHCFRSRRNDSSSPMLGSEAFRTIEAFIYDYGE